MTPNSLYQIVHTLGGRIFHLEEHLKILFEAYYQLFNGYARLSVPEVESQIREAIIRSRPPKDLSFFVTLSLSAQGSLTISNTQRSLYEGYTLRCVMPRAAMVAFDMPHIYLPTTLRSSLTEFVNSESRRNKGDIALRSHLGEVDLANGAQLFGVLQEEIITAKESHSVEHKAAKDAAQSLGIKLIERPILCDELQQLEELFYVDHQGVTAIKSCNSRYYMSITAATLAAEMSEQIIAK